VVNLQTSILNDADVLSAADVPEPCSTARFML